MRKEYDIKKINPRRSTYLSRISKVTLTLNLKVIDYFEKLSKIDGISCEYLINMYLLDCVNKKLKPSLESK